ncbi:phosphoribosylglycinamide formyltransferase [Eubacterium saphenum ATCC 49989]|nr:phosphoribosylglycinamide formyltransferase [Eubacterium saphenum ATCC 49989]
MSEKEDVMAYANNPKNTKIRIAVLVSQGGTNLQALIDAEKAGIINSGKIQVVISNNKDAYALKRAQNAGIRSYSVSNEGDESIESEILDILKREEIDFIVLAGFTMILSANFISMYDHRIINVHPSLIPSFCGKGFYGLKVHEAVLEYGCKVTGATVHFVNEIPDGGEIIMQKAVDILDGDEPESLQRRVMEEAEHVILPQATERITGRMLKEKTA